MGKPWKCMNQQDRCDHEMRSDLSLLKWWCLALLTVPNRTVVEVFNFIDITVPKRRQVVTFSRAYMIISQILSTWKMACCPRQKSFVSPLCARYTFYCYYYNIGEKNIFVSEYNLIDNVPGKKLTGCGAQTSWSKTITTFYWMQTWEHQVI